MMIFLTGGARSGKSAAVGSLLAGRDAPVTQIVTGTASDHEMAERIDRHKEGRPEDWNVVEEPELLTDAVGDVPPGDDLVIDCLTLWVANLLERHEDTEILARSLAAARSTAGRPGMSIVVSNEVGSGLVPMDPVGRRYRDLHGLVNQQWAGLSDRALLVVAGHVTSLTRIDDITV